MMNFDDIFCDLNLQDGKGRCEPTTVPEAPVVSDIPDLDSLLGCGDNTLLELRPSQWLPETQKQQKLPLTDIKNIYTINSHTKSDSYQNDNVVESVISERGDSQEIYLGSQFPLVRKVKMPTTSQEKLVDKSREVSKDSSQPKKKGFKMTTQRSNRVMPQVRDEYNGNSVFQTPAALVLPATKMRQGMCLRSVLEIPEQYRCIFKFQYFNVVQSKVFDDVLYTDRSLVLCSPTGSGKTAVFEMAIVSLLTNMGPTFNKNFKIVYMAPIKALCSERYQDWKEKFEPLGLKVMVLTGDTDLDDFYQLHEVNIVLTTPEKWDSMTRRWRDNKSVVNAIYVFLVDEIHILNDETRGATVEGVISRMKTIQAARSRSGTGSKHDVHNLRFLAVSATLTNIEDVAAWLGTEKSPALYHKFDDNVRPVRLRKVVLGYNFSEKQSAFQFDISLNYKLAGIINTYSEGKPALVFCSTRKSVTQGADTLAKDMKSSFVRSGQHRQKLQNISFHVKDSKLRDLIIRGIGYHHAGMDFQDRKTVEEIFANGDLPVLLATSTLAMGVNLPAHLVIIKSTMYYNMGCHEEYSDTQVLQMIGRAGRPQFDTSATAVIMTRTQTKEKYDSLLNGTQLVESNLHKNLIEHLNAEIVLETITDVSVAVEWLKFTYLYIRVIKNPRHYGMPLGLTQSSLEKRLQDLCMKNLNQLLGHDLIKMNEDTLDVKPTDNGRLMARYCISYKTAELFSTIGHEESIPDLLTIISKCEEFEDIKLRTNEKKTLNTLNKDKNRVTIRYPLQGKIKTTDMKVNCLVQAQFGCLMVQDFALQQDTSRIFRVGCRIMRFLVEFLSQRPNNYKSVLSAIQLCRSFKARLWENSKFVCKQLEGIGPTLSNALVNAGLTTFEKIEQTNPREIELIVNRHPPFGNQVRDGALNLPKYELVIEQIARYSESKAEIVISLQITNREHLLQKSSSGHTCTLLVGDQDNRIVVKQRLMDNLLLKEASWSKKLEVHLATKGPELYIHYISQDWVGLDIDCTYIPNYIGGVRISNSTATAQEAPDHITESARKPARPKQKQAKNQTKFYDSKPKTASTNKVANHRNELKSKTSLFPYTPSLMKRPKLQFADEGTQRMPTDLTKYRYNPRSSFVCESPNPSFTNETNHIDTDFNPDFDTNFNAEGNVLSAIPYSSPYQNNTTAESLSQRQEELFPYCLPNKNEQFKDFAQRNRDKAKVFPQRNRETVPYCSPCESEMSKDLQQRKREDEKAPALIGKSDWPELEMYQKHRQICRADFSEHLKDCDHDLLMDGLCYTCDIFMLLYITAEEAQKDHTDTSSLPDLDFNDGGITTDMFMQDCHTEPYICPVPGFEEQETDFGLVYFGKNGQHESQLADWDYPVTDGFIDIQGQTRMDLKIKPKDTADFHSEDAIECYESEEETHQSKWTGYFSSQSSTASDYLHNKYPARSETHKIVMQNVKGAAGKRDQNGNGALSGNDVMKCKDPEKYCTENENPHRFGQVLAWISNSQNKDISPKQPTQTETENWSDEESFLQFCDVTSTFTSEQGNPMNNGDCSKFAKVFDQNLNSDRKQMAVDNRSIDEEQIVENKAQGNKKCSVFFSRGRVDEADSDFTSIFDGLF